MFHAAAVIWSLDEPVVEINQDLSAQKGELNHRHHHLNRNPEGDVQAEQEDCEQKQSRSKLYSQKSQIHLVDGNVPVQYAFLFFF